MDIDSVPIDSLNHDSLNARSHPDRNRAAIRASLSEFGVVQPLVVNRQTMTVLGGNARLDELRGLGYTDVPVVWVDLDERRAAALALALNRTADLAEWDYDRVGELLEDIATDERLFSASGWEKSELDAITANLDALNDGLVAPGEAAEKKTDFLTLKLIVSPSVKKSKVMTALAEEVGRLWPNGEVEFA